MDTFVGGRLKKVREAAGLSQAVFARAVGLSPQHVSKLEAEKRVPSFGTLRKIASYFNRDISYFFQEKAAGPDSFTLLFRAEAVDDRARNELQKFRRYCDDYLRLETSTGRPLDLAPLYPATSPPSAWPTRSGGASASATSRSGTSSPCSRPTAAASCACPCPRTPGSSASSSSSRTRQAAFALVNSAQSPGRQAFSAAHEYCHYLKDRLEGPVVDNPDVFVDEYVSLYHPREQFAQAFAARFLDAADQDPRDRRKGHSAPRGSTSTRSSS